MRRLFRFTKKTRRGNGVISEAELAATGIPRTHQMVTLKVGGIEMSALYDSGAVPDIMPKNLASRLGLHIHPNRGDVLVESGENIRSDGRVKGVLVMFGTASVPLSFTVLRNIPVDLLFGVPTLVSMNAQLDFTAQVVSLKIGGKLIQLPLRHARDRISCNQASRKVFLNSSYPLYSMLIRLTGNDVSLIDRFRHVYLEFSFNLTTLNISSALSMNISQSSPSYFNSVIRSMGSFLGFGTVPLNLLMNLVLIFSYDFPSSVNS